VSTEVYYIHSRYTNMLGSGFMLGYDDLHITSLSRLNKILLEYNYVLIKCNIIFSKVIIMYLVNLNSSKNYSLIKSGLKLIKIQSVHH